MELKQTLTNVQNEHDELAKEYNTLQEKLSESTQKLDDLQQKYETLEQNFNVVKQDYVTLKESVNDSFDSKIRLKKQLEVQIADREQEITTLKGILSKEQQTTKLQHEQNIKLHADNITNTDKIKTLEEKLSQRTATIQKLEETLNLHLKEKEVLIANNKKILSTNQELGKNYLSNHLKINTQAETIKKLEETNNQLEEHHASDQKALTEMQKQTDMQQVNYHSESEQQKGTIKKLQDLNKQLEKQHALDQQALAEKQEHIDKQQAQISKQQAENKVLSDQLIRINILLSQHPLPVFAPQLPFLLPPNHSATLPPIPLPPLVVPPSHSATLPSFPLPPCVVQPSHSTNLPPFPLPPVVVPNHSVVPPSMQNSTTLLYHQAISHPPAWSGVNQPVTENAQHFVPPPAAGTSNDGSVSAAQTLQGLLSQRLNNNTNSRM